MSCWNQTCGLSHLPIRAGEKVRAFILMPSGRDGNVNPFKGGGICYSTEVFHPLSFPLRAKYNDYGGIEKIEMDVNAEAMLSFLNTELSRKKTPTKDKQLTAVAAFDNIETLVNDVIERGETSLALMLVLDSVYVTAVSGFNTTLNTYSQEWMFSNVVQDLELAKQWLLNMKQQDRGHFPVYDFPSRPDAKKHDRNLAASLFGGYSDNIVDSTFSTLGYIEKVLLDPSTSLTDAAHHMQFCRIMQSTRRPWIGQAGQGSQCEEYRLHRIIAESVIAHVSAHRAEAYEDNGGDEITETDKAYVDQQY